MEAMAAGCIVVTSDLGALPETLGGHGILTSVPMDGLAHANAYAESLINTMTNLQQEWQSGALADRLMAQVQWAHDNYTWDARAAEWIDAMHIATQK
jgi:glycosyltransferase involved in cell wall biosynthesis